MGADADRRAERVVSLLRFRLAGWRGKPVVEDVQWRAAVVVLVLTVPEAEAVAHYMGREGL